MILVLANILIPFHFFESSLREGMLHVLLVVKSIYVTFYDMWVTVLQAGIYEYDISLKMNVSWLFQMFFLCIS